MKVLIYFPENQLGPEGGPAGYLYNLKQQIKKDEAISVEFLSEKNVSSNFFYDVLSGVNRVINFLLYSNPRMRFLKHKIWKSKKKSKVNIKDYDIVHFHGTLDMFTERENLKKYRGLILLTSHSPKVFFRENIEDYMDLNTYNKQKCFCDSLELIDKYAFERSDFVLFPCKEAEEPYYHSWEAYAEIREKLKIRYIPTGIMPEKVEQSRENIRKELNIPDDAFVISYVGRHNEVKGYDILIDLFSKLNNIYIICCGRQGSIEYPNSERWIEVGWTNKPFTYVNASDVMIIPNRETYFDLALLQALSIGTMLLISDTGGNKYFKNNEDKGIFVFNDETDALEHIARIRQFDSNEINFRKAKMKDYFVRNFSNEVFYKNYCELLKNIYGEKR